MHRNFPLLATSSPIHRSPWRAFSFPCANYHKYFGDCSVLFSKSLAMLKTNLLTKMLAETQTQVLVHEKPFLMQRKLCGVLYMQFTCQSTWGLAHEIPVVLRFFMYKSLRQDQLKVKISWIIREEGRGSTLWGRELPLCFNRRLYRLGKGIVDIDGNDTWFVTTCKRPRQLQHEYTMQGQK